MYNDPELDGKYLGTITKDFVVVAEILKEAAYQIKAQGFSDFPIFPISKIEIPIGELLLAKDQRSTNWTYRASYLDEFVERQLIDKDKTEEFKKNYKDSEEFCCLFVVDRSFTKFVFIPYPVD